MDRNCKGQSVGWTFSSGLFHVAPGLRWRQHMSQIAAKTRTVSPIRAPLYLGPG